MQSRTKRFFVSTLLILFIVATAIRVAPFFMTGDRFKAQAIIDDGYYMLTIARNIALGYGFSISDGTVPTNGTQPLCTLLYTLGFHLVQCDKIHGIAFVLAAQTVISLLVAILLFVGARKYFYSKDIPPAVPFVVAVLWYASPTTLSHTQNGLETALASLAILLCLIAYDALTPRLNTAIRSVSCILLGVLLGLTFLVRNDTCFLILAVLAVHAVLAIRRGVLGRGIVQNVIIGATSLLVASPWLWFNVTHFGHFVPVSGRAESYESFFGSNFYYALAAMLENVSLVFRIPLSMEGNFTVQQISGAILLILLLLAFAHRRWLAERFSPGVAILAVFVGCLFIYYSLFFEMPSFLGRYFFPAVMLSILVLVPAAAEILMRLYALRFPGPQVATAAVFVLVVICLGLNIRTFSRPANLQMQSVRWVQANVPDGDWVGAVQTGTLGYFYDHTINLDGKVDPQAFTARMAGKIPDYLLQRNVRYLVDWVGITDWAKLPDFARHFELVLADHEQNLGVLKRRPASLAAK